MATPTPSHSPDPVPRRWLRRVLAVVLYALGAWLSYADVLGRMGAGAAAPRHASAAVFGLAETALYALGIVTVFRLARRFPLGRRGAGNVTPHLLAAPLFALSLLVLQMVAVRWLGLPPGRALTAAVQGLFVYGLLLGIAHAVEYRRRFRRKEVDELRLRADLSEAELSRTRAELRALKMELNPHFLFNSLHAVSTLLHLDVGEAERVLLQLSDLLRRSLRSLATQEVSLEEEVEGLEPFLQIERACRGELLRVDFDLAEAALDARVPHMILQPLVENAIKHGLAPRGGGGRIVVSARTGGDRLVLEVRDDGVGLRAGVNPTAGTGVGMANVRERLRQLYGDQAGFDLLPAPEGGTIARLVIPVRADAPAPARMPASAPA